MVSETVCVVNKMGFHMRPASAFVQAMVPFKGDITIFYNSKEIDGRSIINIIAAGMKQGSELEIRCSGPDEAEMLKAAVELIRSGFGEE